jgi:CrcB protein
VARFLLVCLGSALGGGLRYLVSLWTPRALGTGFPYGTLLVNIVGSFLIGLIMYLGLRTQLVSANTRLFLTTGVMGGLTTYSTFNYESLKYFEDGAWRLGALNITVTLVACAVAGVLGVACARAIAPT